MDGSRAMQEQLPRERVWSDRNMGIIFLMEGLSGAALLVTFLAVKKSNSRTSSELTTECGK